MNPCAELFTKLLNEKNLSFETRTLEDGDELVSFPYKGKKISMFFSEDDGYYLSTYMTYENVPEDKYFDLLIVCNELNTKYKWVTYYIDSDRDIIIHNDAILSLDIAANQAFEILLHFVSISDKAKDTIMKAIYA